MNWYLDVWKKYAEFTGRATRQAYWMFYLFNFIICCVFMALGQAASIFKTLYMLYCLAICIPGLAVGARRLHDIGKSGWWQLIGFIPLVGWIWLIVLLAQPTKQGPNPFDGVTPPPVNNA